MFAACVFHDQRYALNILTCQIGNGRVKETFGRLHVSASLVASAVSAHSAFVSVSLEVLC